MRTSGEKVRISDEAERVQSVLYSNIDIRSLSRLYTRPIPFRSPFQSISKPHHNSVLCLRRGPQEQRHCVSILHSKGPQ